jgi:hypothetical protein
LARLVSYKTIVRAATDPAAVTWAAVVFALSPAVPAGSVLHGPGSVQLGDGDGVGVGLGLWLH